MDWEFELLEGPYGGTSEGPAWDGQAVLFTHIPESRIMRYDPSSGAITEYRSGTNNTNGLMFDAEGRLYGCQTGGHCIVRFEPDGSQTQLPNLLDGKRHNRPNDLAIDSKGRIWFTDPFGRGRPDGERQLDHASVLRHTPQADGGWKLERMTFDTTSPNGTLLSKDERTLYVAQSDYDGTRELRAYPLKDDDTLGPYKVLHTFGNDSDGGVQRGVDGMCLDSDGNIVACAGWNEAGPGPMIYIFSPTGRVLETHPMPVDRVTNCTFGDPGLNTLYVTTGLGHFYRVRNTGRRGYNLYPR
jgi:gluconolactonase